MENPESYYDRRLLNLTSSCFLNSFKKVDWNEIIQSLQNRAGLDLKYDSSHWNNSSDIRYQEIKKLWDECDFNKSSVKWTNYYPEKDFEASITDSVASYLRVNVHRSWISRVRPGFCAPWHWDVDDNEEQYLSIGMPKRYSIFIGPPALGHVFLLGKDYIYNVPQGSIFKWKNYKEWHAGMNVGLSSKWMFHLLAY